MILWNGIHIPRVVGAQCGCVRTECKRDWTKKLDKQEGLLKRAIVSGQLAVHSQIMGRRGSLAGPCCEWHFNPEASSGLMC